MKFIFADSLDYVDPNYIFEEDRSPPGREPYWDDKFPHEILGEAPYDGILVSKAVVGGFGAVGKYSESQAMRFRRVGAREFLRYKEADYPGSFVFGDCGAFSYHKLEEPPYSVEEIVDFYADSGFTHGCSVDHIIFDFFDDAVASTIDADRYHENRRRLDITLKNAEDFLATSKRLGNSFTPLGVVHGWSPSSMANAARRLVDMGYSYLAVGGMVPLRSPEIKKALRAIRREIGDSIRIHILGFAKADEIASYGEFNISSFDTTSPLIRAFKDSRSNYYLPKQDGGLDYYSAIRIPQSIENNQLKNLAKEGIYSQENLQKREFSALSALRSYDNDEASHEDALEAVMAYTAPLAIGRDNGHSDTEVKKLETLRSRYSHTLSEKPWKRCGCTICKSAGVEVIIFRASNRNKRRGIHNLQAYRHHIRAIERMGKNDQDLFVQGHISAAE